MPYSNLLRGNNLYIIFYSAGRFLETMYISKIKVMLLINTNFICNLN